MADPDATHALSAFDEPAASHAAGHGGGHGHGSGHGEDDAHGEPLGDLDLRAWAAALAGAAIAGLVAVCLFIATQA